MEVVLFLIACYFVLAVLNSWGEQSSRLRCGARVGLFGRCPIPVSESNPRCNKHRGLRRARWP